MKLRNILLIALLYFLFVGCSSIAPVSVIALDIDYLNNTNNVLGYNGSIDITGTYLVNGVPFISGGATSNYTDTVKASYGEMYVNDSTTATTINTAGFWVNVTTLLEGFTNRVTYNSSKLIIEDAGMYFVTHSQSFSDGASNDFETTIGVNGDIQHQCEAERKLGATGDIGNSGSNCILNLSIDDEITLMTRNNDNTNNPIFADVNVVIHKLEYSKQRAFNLPNNTSISYNNDSLISSIFDNYTNFDVNTSYTYNSTTGFIDTATITDTSIGTKTINYEYTDGLLTGVTYS